MDDLSNLKINELLIHFPSLRKINEDMSNLDEIGKYMIKKLVIGKKSSNILYCDHTMVHYKTFNLSVGAQKVDKPGDKSSIWKQIKQEFYNLICTKDRRYSKVRSKLFATTKQLSNTAVLAVSAVIAKSIGVVVGVVSGAVAALLFALATMGLTVYCKVASNS